MHVSVDCTSDHNSIHATLCLKNKRPTLKYIKARDYKRLDEDKFRYNIEIAPLHISQVFEDKNNVLWAWQDLLFVMNTPH